VRRDLRIVVLMLVPLTIRSYSCSKNISQDTRVKVELFLKQTVVDTLEEDYRSHNMSMHVVVTDVRIDRLTKKETAQDNVYFAQGRVSYIVKGKRRWKDKEGNVMQLDPEAEISHWFTCGVLEDRYLGALFKDDRNRLTFFADKPE
jgi:hypothetical protein